MQIKTVNSPAKAKYFPSRNLALIVFEGPDFEPCDGRRLCPQMLLQLPGAKPSVVMVMWVKITVDIESGDNRVTPGDPQFVLL
jgi:hypothetical protein